MQTLAESPTWSGLPMDGDRISMLSHVFSRLEEFGDNFLSAKLLGSNLSSLWPLPA